MTDKTRTIWRSDIHPEQIKIFRAMPPEQKLDLALRLYRSASQLKAAALHHQHPDWDGAKVQAELRKILLYART